MPFTPAHLLAVIPMRRWRVCDWPSLVIGCMIPDLSYVLELWFPKLGVHTLEGIFYFCVPMTLLLRLHWGLYLRPFLLQNWGQAVTFSFVTSCLTCILGAFLGSASHVFWDAWTHRSGAFVQMLPSLRAALHITSSLDRPVYNVLQHMSSIVGLIGVLFWYRRDLRGIYERYQTRNLGERRRILNAFVKFALLAIGLCIFFNIDLMVRGAILIHVVGLEYWIGAFFFRCFAGLLVVYLYFPFWFGVLRAQPSSLSGQKTVLNSGGS
jgi:hypothetical protein